MEEWRDGLSEGWRGTQREVGGDCQLPLTHLEPDLHLPRPHTQGICHGHLLLRSEAGVLLKDALQHAHLGCGKVRRNTKGGKTEVTIRVNKTACLAMRQ